MELRIHLKKISYTGLLINFIFILVMTVANPLSAQTKVLNDVSMDSQEWGCDPLSEEKAVPISLGCEPDPIPTPIPDTMPDIVKNLTLEMRQSGVVLTWDGQTNGGWIDISRNLDNSGFKKVNPTVDTFFENGIYKTRAIDTNLDEYRTIQYRIKACAAYKSNDCRPYVFSDVQEKDFLLSVVRNTNDSNGNGLRDDVDFVLENQGNFSESEKELAELFAISLTAILESATSDPLFLYQNIYNMAQVNLCYEDPTKISNIEILLLDTYEAYSRYSEVDAMVSQSQYGQFAFSPKCNYSALKAKSVEAGISFLNYYLSRNRQIILRHLEQVDKHNQLLENPQYEKKK